MNFPRSVTLIVAFVLAHPAVAEKADWAEGSSVHNEGANREYCSRAAILLWNHLMGDWRDAVDSKQGDVARAVTDVIDNDMQRPVRWDVTALVKQWVDGKHPNQGLLLRVNGWSARGLFKMTVPDGNALAGTTPVRFDCYHAEMQSRCGANWIWSKGYRGYLKTKRWYTIEQFCRLNTPEEKDGVLRAWVDGRLAFEKTDVLFRLADDLKIDQIWMNIFHGGTVPSPYDQHVFIDNVAITATKFDSESSGSMNCQTERQILAAGT